MTATDPLTALLTRDWAAVGGWSLFLGMCLLIVIGSFREYWVPGRRYRRLEEAAKESAAATAEALAQNSKLIESNELSGYILKELTSRRGDPA